MSQVVEAAQPADGARRPQRAAQAVSLRRRLLWVALAGTLPLAIIAAVCLAVIVRDQQREAERTSLDVARLAAAAINVELQRVLAMLSLLGQSRELDHFELSAYGERLQRLLPTLPGWLCIRLIAPDGEVLVSAIAPEEATPGLPAEPRSFEQLLKTRSPQVSALAQNPDGKWSFYVRVPVLREQRLRYVLSAELSPEIVQHVVNEQLLPENWTLSVFDAGNRRVSRSKRQAATLAGAPAPSLARLMSSAAAEGTGITTTLEGDEVYTAYVRLRDFGWTVAVGLPTSQAESAAVRAFGGYGGGMVLSFMLAIAAALLAARRINLPMHALQDAARAIGAGGVPAAVKSDIQEVAEVGSALVAAAAARRASEQERGRVLVQLERTRRELVQQVTDLQRLHGLSTTLLGLPTLERQLSATLQALCDFHGVRCGLISLYDRATQRLRPAAALGLSPELLNRLRALKPGVDANGLAFAEQQRVVIEDTETDPRFTQFAETARQEKFRAVHSTPLRTRDGEMLGAVAVYLPDPRRPSERELRLADLCAGLIVMFIERAQAEAGVREADRRKDEFLATLAHELRNPLAPIRSAVDVMRLRPVSDPALQQCRDVIGRQLEQLTRLVDDLLDVSRITRGKIRLELKPLEISAIVERAIEMQQPVLQARSQRLTVWLPQETLMVHGDLTRLSEAIGNLLNNAAKYSDEGGAVSLRVERQVHNGQPQVAIRVRDSGAGIPPEMLPRVFELFTQVDHTLHRAQGGIGVGLALVRKLAQMHGGAVEGYSEGIGKGAEFILRLPLLLGQPAAAPEHERVASLVPAQTRVLVVDDNRDAAQMLATMLRLNGVEVHVAHQGEEALKLAERIRPQLMLMDLGMPGLDGLELAPRIRAMPWGADVLLVAQTGWGREEDRARTRAAGFDAHLTKPVDQAQVLRLLMRARSRNDRGEIASQQG